MSNWLRTASTRTLLATGIGLLLLIGGSTAIASAIDASPPAPIKLSTALKTLDRRPTITGLSARVVFKNNLLGDLASAGSRMGVTDPLISGGSGRLWVSADGQMRVELQSDGGGGDAQMVLTGKTMQIWHAARNTMYSMDMKGDKNRKRATGEKQGKGKRGVERWLADLRKDWNLPNPKPLVMAGRPAYSLTASPKQTMGQLGDLQIVWDAQYKLPLALRIWSKDGGDPVIDIAASEVDFTPVDPTVFKMPLPAGAKQVQLSGKSYKRSAKQGVGQKLSLAEASALAGLQLPNDLQGQAFSGAWSDNKGRVMIGYGKDLNGWILQVAPPGKAEKLLESVQLGSTDGQALVTPLGGMISWQTPQHRYSLIGSHSKQDLVSAATSLAG